MKSTKNGNHLLIAYTTMILYSSIMIACSMPVAEIAPEIVPAINEEPVPPVIEEIEMELKSIAEYEKYVFADGKKLFGLVGSEKEIIVLEDVEGVLHPFNNFYRKNGKVFFSVVIMEDGPEEIPESDPVQFVKVPVTHYYIQTGSDLEETEEGLYPLVPESDFVEMGVSPYSIVTGDYEGSPMSSIKQEINELEKPVKNFLKIDSYFSTLQGLWFTVSIGTPGAEKGLYFWELDSGRVGSHVIESGRIW